MADYYEKRIMEAMDNEDLLTEWEYDFVQSLAGKGLTGAELSDKQKAVLNRIGEKMARGRR